MSLIMCNEGISRISSPFNISLRLVEEAIVPAVDPDDIDSYTVINFSGYNDGIAVMRDPIPTATGWRWDLGVDIFLHNGGEFTDSAAGLVYYIPTEADDNVLLYTDLAPIKDFLSIGDAAFFIGKISVNGTS